MSKKTNLHDACKALNELAPLHLAESWDNVGLLVQAREKAKVGRIFLTIDLSREVMAEALAARADLIVSYHPPIFSGLKRLVRGHGHAKEEIVLDAVKAGISIYSPHTALDAAPEGLNDWLIGGFGVHASVAIQKRELHPGGMDTKVVVFVPEDEVEKIRGALRGLGCGVIGAYADCGFELEGEGTFRGLEGSQPRVGAKGKLERVREIRLEMLARSADLAQVAVTIRSEHSYEEPAFDFYPLRPRIDLGTGQGRFAALKKATPLSTVLRRIKKHLGLSRLRVAKAVNCGDDPEIRSVAVCAGAGGSVLMGQPADLLLTGEMRHHDVLECVERGITVVLCDHTNTERGYLPRYAERIAALLPAVEIIQSALDRDPLEIV